MRLTLETLAAFVQAPQENAVGNRYELLRMHIADTLEMLRAGLDLEEGRAAAKLGIPLVAWCAAARCTEADDIHLTSCTTPGSVVVPVALHLASAGVFSQWEDFCEAVLAGYEVLIRLGHAIDGPRVLAKKVWPTLFAAPLAAAAVAAKAWKLSEAQTAGALATALACSSGTAAPAVGAMSSRWMALGVAAHAGVLAAEGARQGLSGDRGLMERYRGRVAGVRISTKRWLDGLGERFLFDEICLKPYAVAMQALAAIEACRSLAAELDVESISEILVKVPMAQLQIIDRPGVPQHRMAFVASAQFQIAKALAGPGPAPGPAALVAKVAAKVRVEHGPHLERHWPGAWPAQVTIRAGGRRLTRTLLHPSGDWRNPLTWDGIAAKPAAVLSAHL